MNLLQRILALASKDNDAYKPLRWTPTRQAGMVVDHDTALTLSALFACVRLISEDIAKLPWHTYRRTSDESRERVAGSRIETLLNVRPNPDMTAFSFRETLVAWALTWGNGYAEIERDAAGRPQGLWPLAPNRVECKRDDMGVYYEVANEAGEKSLVDGRDMFHLHGLGFDGLTGYSVVSYAARSIGLGMAQDQFGASFFGNNAVLGGYLEHPGRLSQSAFDRLKEFVDKRRGTAEAFKPAILEEGMKWTQAGIPPEDAQFIESRKLTVNEMARWFRVPPHKIADLERATFSNIEEQSISYVNDTLVSWITRLEQEANFKLIGARSAVDYTKINIKGLLRGSSQQRAEFYREMRNLGVYSVNEIRALEDENPIGPEGDKRVMQLNMTTLEKIGEEREPAPQALPEPQEDEEEPQAKAIHYRLVEKALVGVYAREQRRIGESKELVPESSFYDWLNHFAAPSGDHMDFATTAVGEALSTVAADIGAGSVVPSVMEHYADRHIDQIRTRAINTYKGSTTVQIYNQARREAEFLVKDLIETKLIQRLENKRDD